MSTHQAVGSMRVAALRALLRSRTVRGAIIFANTRAETFRVTSLLEEEGYSVGVLNGEMAQRDRERTLTKLKSDTISKLTYGVGTKPVGFESWVKKARARQQFYIAPSPYKN